MNIQDAMTLATQKAWSPFNSDEAKFGTVSNATMLAEFNSSVIYNISRDDFPFKDTSVEQYLTTAQNFIYLINMGIISDIYIDGDKAYLERIAKDVFLDTSITGKPVKYYLDYWQNSQLRLVVHPTPDKAYMINVAYQAEQFIIDDNYNTKTKFTTANDTLNIPENLQDLFWECVILRAMQTAIKDNSDEYYQPVKDEYGDMWQLFVKKTSPVVGEKRVII